jgi:hypothetical protein
VHVHGHFRPLVLGCLIDLAHLGLRIVEGGDLEAIVHKEPGIPSLPTPPLQELGPPLFFNDLSALTASSLGNCPKKSSLSIEVRSHLLRWSSMPTPMVYVNQGP